MAYNGTCGVTHLPIGYGDEVVLFFLSHVQDEDNIDANGHCSPNAVWSPRSIQFYGKYDDYGGVDCIPEDWHTKYLLKSLEIDLVDIAGGSNKYHEPPVSKADLTTIKHLQELIHVRRLKVKRMSWAAADKKERHVGMMLVLRDVWDEMIKETGEWDEWTLETAIADGVAFYNALCADLNTESENPLELRHWRNKDNVNLLGNGNIFKILTRDGSEVDAYTISVGIKDYHTELLMQFAKEGLPASDTRVAEVLTELAKYLMFAENMRLLRRTWMPQGGAGNNDNDLDLHQRILEVGLAVVKERKARWSAEDGGDEDEILV